MKKSTKTRITALMLTGAALSLGALSVSCGVYGPAPEERIDAPEEPLAYTAPEDVRIDTTEGGDTL